MGSIIWPLSLLDSFLTGLLTIKVYKTRYLKTLPICRAKASATKDVEAGEKKELLDDEEDDEEESVKKAEGEEGDDEVKVAGSPKKGEGGDVVNGDDDDAEKGALVESPGKKSQVRLF